MIIPIKTIIIEEINNGGFAPSGATKQLGSILGRNAQITQNKIEVNKPKIPSINTGKSIHDTSNKTLTTQGYKTNSESRSINANTNAQKEERLQTSNANKANTAGAQNN